MNEIGKIKRLMKIASSSAETMQDCDRKRLAMLELGNIGDAAAVPVLLDNIDNPLFSITVLDALGKMDFNKKDERLPNIRKTIERKIESGSPYERTCAAIVLNRITDDKKFPHPDSKKPDEVKKKMRT